MDVDEYTGDVDDDSNDSVRGMSDLMLVELVMCILPLALIVVLFQDAPPTPPSKSTQLKSDVARQKASIHDSSTPSSELDSQLLKDDLYKLAGSKDYLVLFCAFSIGVGFFNSLMTLLNQLIAPFGYRCICADTLYTYTYHMELASCLERMALIDIFINIYYKRLNCVPCLIDNYS